MAIDLRRLYLYWDSIPTIDDDYDDDDIFEEELDSIEDEEDIFEEELDEDDTYEYYDDVVLYIGYCEEDTNEVDVIGQVPFVVEPGFTEGTVNILADIVMYDESCVEIDPTWDVLRLKVVEQFRHADMIGMIREVGDDELEYVSFPETPGANSMTDTRIAFPVYPMIDKYFVDTEFTGLVNGTDLISIGVVSSKGDIFYAESNEYNCAKVNDFVEEHVIKNLAFNEVSATMDQKVDPEDGTIDVLMKGNTDDIAEAFEEWLNATSKPGHRIQLVGDVCQYDKVLVDELFGGALSIPENMSPTWIDINSLIADTLRISDEDAFDVSRMNLAKALCDTDLSFMEQHNAINDAIVIHIIYDALTK